MLSFNSVVVFSENPSILTDFYKKVFQKDPDWRGGEFVGFKTGNGFFSIGPHQNVHGKNTNPERIIFNFETTDVKSEYERLLESGVKSIKEPYNPSEEGNMLIATLEDIDGNYFQLVSPINF